MRFRHLSCMLAIATILISCKGPKPASPVDSYEFKMGEYLNYYEKYDSAFLFFNRVLDKSSDSLLKAMALNYMGDIQSKAGDYFGAQESVLASIKLLDESNQEHDTCMFSNYNTLANISVALKDYTTAIGYFNKALRFKTERDYVLYALNNKALTFQKIGDYKTSVSILDSILREGTKDSFLLAKVVSNLARSRWLKDKDYPVNEEFNALQIRMDINDELGMNASYSHLSDYYSEKRPDSALIYAAKMYEVATMVKSPDDQLEALEKLVRLSEPGKTRQFFEQYQHLNDSLQTARNSAKNQFALVRFEAEKAKTDNLLLQQRITRQHLIIYGALIATILIITGIIVYYQRKRRNLVRKSEEAIRKSLLRTSQKVHDVVANGLYRIMNDLEHRPAIEKDELLNKVETLYEQSRDISYEKQEPSSISEIALAIEEMLGSFSGDDRKVVIAGDVPGTLGKLPLNASMELKHVLQELMVNMKKHSGASNVAIRFRTDEKGIWIQYRDDGNGISRQLEFGNGLKSTVNRIYAIGGGINFENPEPSTGTRISISLPTVK